MFTPRHHGGSGPPLLLLHGITDTWRTWELVLPALEERHEVLAPTLAGHAGGPELGTGSAEDAALDALERAMDEAGFDTAHVAGNSLGGYLALKLAARGRARTVTALAPAGGWAEGDRSWQAVLQHFGALRGSLEAAAPHADAIAASPEGRRRATADITVNHEHIPSDLIAHQIRGAAACAAVEPLNEEATRAGWTLDAERITCPVRVVWGTADRLLRWPGAAARYRDTWLPHADWVVLDDVGHCAQLDVPLETAQLILGVSAPR